MAEPTKAENKALHTLRLSQFRPQEFVRRVHVATPELGTTWEEMQEARYWSHVARNMNPGDEVVVLPEDQSWYGRLLVRHVETATAVVVALEHKVFDTEINVDISSQYEVVFAGPIAKHRVVRKSDKAIIEEGISTKAQAFARLAELEKMTARRVA